MTGLFVFVCLVSWAAGQYVQNGDNEHGWDIRLAVPGEPGSDYPTLGSIPRTSFSCAGKEPGYYADLETNCQAFRVCTIGSTYGFQSFLCPNGTLFNQAVFVCDWWMNVNCENSQQLFNNNNDKFGNLRLGPQLMKDIRKMITHPMRNPYDKNSMKSNLIVMQDYKPPFGQLFPNSNLIASQDRSPKNIYSAAKLRSSYSDSVFAASTPSSQYVPANFNNVLQPPKDAEVFQRQRQNGQYTQNNRYPNNQNVQSGNIILNGQAGRLVQSTPTYAQSTQNYNQGNQFTQRFVNNIRATQQQNAINTNHAQREQYYRHNSQNTAAKLTNGKQSEFGVSLTKQQYNNYNANQQKQPFTYNAPQYSNEVAGTVGNEAKQNLVSNVPSTVIAKTLTYNRIIQEPKPGGPRSRITFKTWIVKPSKAAKLIAAPTPYTYDRPTLPPTEKLVDDTTPYVYNKPTERLVADTEGGYAYDKPKVAAKQITQSSRLYLPPSSPKPTISGRLYLPPTTVPPTKPSRLYLAPTTFNPPARLYLPQANSPAIPARQFLSPNGIQQPTYNYQSEQLRASPTSPSPVFAAPEGNINNPSFSQTKHSHINTKRNNLTFSDILTKEKLDITVNDIVKDTGSILHTASPQQFGQLRQADQGVDYPDDNYLPPEHNNDKSGEILTPQSPTVSTISQSARLVERPLSDLEPPEENENNLQVTNQLSQLPFYKEPSIPTNTIERTVSLKISIPERVAAYLFKNNESDSERLEILNTGSSNYLVLTNHLTRNSGTNFIPIGKLIEDKHSNISNSQALVYSFLADSINAAKEYNNIAQQNIISTPAQPQFQNVNSEDLARITNKVSQLTSAQYSENNYNTNNNQRANLISTQTTSNLGNNIGSNAAYTNGYYQNQQVQSSQYNNIPSQQIQPQYSAQLQTSSNGVSGNIQLINNQNQLYSGQLYQLPVLDVTNQIYNAQYSANLVQPSNTPQQHLEAAHLEHGSNEHNLANSSPTQHNPDVEIVQSHSIPQNPVQNPAQAPAKLQQAPSHEQEHSQENTQAIIGNLLNSGNGITAQLQDKIVGTIPHPLEENKLVTYKKDQSYYVYTKLNENTLRQNAQSNAVLQNNPQSAKIIQGTNIPNIVTFQFIPSVSYQLEDEKDQQRILNAFQIDEYGSPKNAAKLVQAPNPNQGVVSSNVDYSVDHATSSKQVNGQYNDVNNLYAGPSSYSAPQSSVGSLGNGEQNQKVISRLEQFDEKNGYSKVSPARQFSY